LGALYSRRGKVAAVEQPPVVSQVSWVPFHAKKVHDGLYAIQHVEVLLPSTHAMQGAARCLCNQLHALIIQN
jgi:hypothetical protein